MKSLRSVAVHSGAGSRTSGGPLARLLGLAPAALLLSALFTVWAGPLAAPVAAAGGDWPQFRGGPDHSGYNSTENTLEYWLLDDLGVEWTAAAAGAIESSPAVADGVVYVGSASGLYAFAVGCGRHGGTCTPLWTGATGNTGHSAPAVADGVVYIGSVGNHKLYAFAVGCGTGGGTCTPLWTGNTGGPIDSSPTVADGAVYVGSEDHSLYAFQVGCASGGVACTPLWTATTGGAIDSSPAVAYGQVFVGSADHSLYAFQAGCASGGATCTPLWTGTTGGAISSSPAVASVMVYVGSEDGKLYAFQIGGGDKCTGSPPLETCLPTWKATTGGPIHSSPAATGEIMDGVVYVGSDDGDLYAFPSFDVDCWGFGICTPLWKGTTGGAVKSSPIVARGVVYVGSGDATLNAFVVGCGSGGAICTPRWTSSTTGGAIESSPAVANGAIYVGSGDELIAFDLSVDQLYLEPDDATIAAGESQGYAALGADADGIVLGDDTANTTFTISGGGSCTGTSCTATEAADYTVTGTDGSATGTATLHVTHAALDHLVLSPPEATIAAGDTREYTATGFDAYDNSLGDVTSSTTFSISGSGSCTGAFCTTTQAGDQTVTGTDGGATGTATLHVTHAAAGSLVLSPTRKTIVAGGSQAYTATGFDAYGDSWNDTSAVTFTISGEGSCTNNSCTATGPGNHTVTGTDGGATGTATLHVFSIGPGDWPQFHHDATHEGYDSHETTLSTSSVVNLGVAWTADTGITMFASPTVADGVVYVVTGDGYLDAFAVGCASGGATCTPLWIGHGLNGLNGSAAVADGEVFVGGGDGVYAFPVDCRSDGGICAPLWRDVNSVAFGYTPVVADGVVYFAGGDKKLYAFDDDCRSDGGNCSPLWTATSTLGGSISGAPTVADGRVFVAFEVFGGWWYSSTLYAFDAAGATGCSGIPKTCSPLWTATPDLDGIFGTPTAADGMVYVTGSYGSVYAYAVDCASGGDACQPLWKGGNGGTASPAVANGVVYVGDAGSLDAFPAACRNDGGICAPLWTANTGGVYGNSPAVANGVVYVASSDGNLYAFDANGLINCSGPTDYVTCLPLWTAATRAEQIAGSVSPAVANGVVYVGDAGGILYAFGLDHGPLDHLVLSPSGWSINAGGTRSYKAEGFDTHGNSWDVTAITTFTVVGGSCTGTLCTSTLAGDDTVTGTIGAATGTATLHVNPGSVASVVVTPPAGTITADGHQTYFAEGFDAYGNDLGDVTSSTYFIIDDTWLCTYDPAYSSDNSCNPTVPGDHTITGRHGGIYATVTLHVNPGVLNHLVLSPSNASITAGGSRTYSAEGFDAHGNDLGDLTSATTFTISGAGGCSGTSCTSTVAADHTVTGTDGVATGTAVLHVTPAAATTLVVSGMANPQTAGQAGSLTVMAVDQYGNTATAYGGTVHFTSSDGAAVLPANATLTNGVGTFSVTLRTAGTRSVTATDTVTASITGVQSGIVVTPAAATTLVVSGLASPQTAGQAGSLTVMAVDQYGNTATAYGGTVHFTSSDGAAVLPANATLTNGVGTFSVTLRTAGTRSVTATDTVTASITGVQSGIVVTPAAATTLVVSGLASPQTAGQAGSLTVMAVDQYGNTATAYGGTVHFTSSDGAAVLPANATLINGVGTFSVTLKTAGSRSVTATDTVTASITGSQSGIVVTPAAARTLAVSTANPWVAGASHTVTITAKDAYGNTATGYLGTVHVTSSDAQAVLPADYTFVVADAGVHRLSVTLKTTGSRSVTATDTVTASITGSQSGIVVTPAAARTLAVSTANPWVAGASHTVTITAKDAYGNTATGYLGTVHVTSSDAQAVLPADYTFVVADAGFHRLSVTLKTAGSRSVTATDTVTASITGSQSGIVVTPAAARTLAVSTANPWVAGASHTVTITAKDAYGNTATGYLGTVHVTSSDAQAVLPADYTFVVADAGVHRLSVTLKTAGSRSVTATDTVTASITGSQSGIVVTPAAARTLAVSTANPWVAGASHTVTITAKDAYGNTATGYLGTVHVTSSDAQAVLPADYTFVVADAGVHRLSVTLKTAGSQWIRATDTVTASITGSQTISVS